jgi:hypothetical protein
MPDFFRSFIATTTMLFFARLFPVETPSTLLLGDLEADEVGWL